MDTSNSLCSPDRYWFRVLFVYVYAVFAKDEGGSLHRWPLNFSFDVTSLCAFNNT